MRWRRGDSFSFSSPSSYVLIDEFYLKVEAHKEYVAFSIFVIVCLLSWLLIRKKKCMKIKMAASANSDASVANVSKDESKPIAIAHDPISMRIHYTAQKCADHPKYIKVCIMLLQQCPLAVNQSMPPHGYTPFLVIIAHKRCTKRACMIGCAELISYMLKNGANVNICSTYGDSPVYLAVYAIASKKCQNFEAIRHLLNAGCPVNVPKRDGYTALHVAARFGDSELVRWLLVNGADPDPTTCRHSPYEYALKYGHTSTADLLYINLEL